MKKKRNRGRPVGSTAERTRGVPIQFRVFADEKAAYVNAAGGEGKLSAWIRDALNREAKGAK